MPPDEDTQIINIISDENGNVKIDVPEQFDDSQPSTILHNGKKIGTAGILPKPAKVVITAPEKDAKLTAAGTAKAEVYDIFDKLMPAEPVQWTSSDPKILTITADTGTYTPVTTGSVTLTAASKTDPTKTAAVPVTVEKQGG